MRLGQGAFGFAADDTDDARTEQPGPLQRNEADTAGRRVQEYPVAGAHTVAALQQIPGCQSFSMIAAPVAISISAGSRTTQRASISRSSA